MPLNNKSHAEFDEKSSLVKHHGRYLLLSQLRHNLRAPVNAIIGYSEMWLEEGEEKLPAGVHRELESIHRAGQYLLSNINKMLDPIKVSALEGPEISQVVTAIQQALYTHICTIMVHCEILQEVSGGSEDDISRDLDKIIKSTRGLMEIIDKINDIYQRDSADTTDATASVMYQDTMDTFHLTEEETEDVAAQAGGAILVVDDNEMNCDLLSRRLQRDGYTVVTAANGREGLASLANGNFDVVLLDLIMPEINGFQMLETMKSDASLQHIPVIMLSSLDKMEIIVHCIKMGADDYLPKPINAVLLTARIKACMEKKRLRDREQLYLQQLKDWLSLLHNTQDQLIQSAKMASLGGLVAGVAHEVNTPIGISVTAASHLATLIKELDTQFDEGSLTDTRLDEFIKSSQERIALISSSLTRAAALIQSFKQVSVDQSNEAMRLFNFKSYMEDIVLSLRYEMKNTPHQVKIDCNENLQIESYPGVWSQIISNFILNSLRHAFTREHAGTMTIAASLQNDMLHVRYSDDGCGMPPEVVEKIFEPFFTTKRNTGGSGLGMHIVYNLVTLRLKGTIEVKSAPDAGAEFLIVVPILGE